LTVDYRGSAVPLNRQNFCAIGKAVIEGSSLNVAEDFTGLNEDAKKAYVMRALGVVTLDYNYIQDALMGRDFPGPG